jgi:putative endonuclease
VADDPRHALGKRGEAAAERHLRRLGMRVVARRYRTPFGELDLVMSEGATLVFVEVKTLRSDTLEQPHERIRSAQERRLLRAARSFLAERRCADRPCRFDVVAVTWPADGPPQVTHHADAILPSG